MNTTTSMPEDGLTMAQLMNNQFTETNTRRFNAEEDKGLHVRFFLEPVEQTAESIMAGRRIWADTEHMEIMVPGDKTNIIKRMVFPMDRDRFPVHYARFKQGLADQTVGTKLSELSSLTMSKVKEYEFFNIRTVEQLAAAADGSSVATGMMGFNSDKAKAVAFLNSAKHSAPLAELNARQAKSDAEVENLRKQLADMDARLEKANTPKAK